jgi:hypothetical protein
MSALDVAAFLRRLTFPVLPSGGDLESLAAVWPVNPWRLARALADAGAPVTEDQAEAVLWVLDEHLAEHAWRREIVESTNPAIVDTMIDIPATPGPGLVIDGPWRPLPLEALARDVARQEPRGRLTVRGVAAGSLHGFDGLYTSTRRGGLVLLDERLEGDRLEEVVAHELAHAIDPELGDTGCISAEDFADTLGAALLARRPESVLDAAPLVAAALEATGRRRRHRVIITASLAELLEHALTEAGVAREISLEVIAAHVDRSN